MLVAPSSVQQFPGGCLQAGGQLFHNGDCRVAGTALEVADIGAVDAGLERQMLLAPFLLVTKAPEIGGKTKSDIHA